MEQTAERDGDRADRDATRRIRRTLLPPELARTAPVPAPPAARGARAGAASGAAGHALAEPEGATGHPPAEPAPGGADDGRLTADSVTAVIRHRLADVLGLSEHEVADDQPFADLGLDSIFRMELVRLLNSRYSVDIKAAELYQRDTPARLCELVMSLLPPGPGWQDQAPPPPTTARLALPEEPVPEPPVPQPPVPEPPVPEEPVPEPPVPSVAAAVERLLAAVLHSVAGQVPADGLSFADGGLTSFDMLRIISSLESRLGRLRKTLLFDHPTLPALAAHLAEKFGPQVTDLLAAPERAASEDLAGPPADPSGAVIATRRELASTPDIEQVIADITGRHGMELGLAGRDIAPLLFLGSARRGYFTFAVHGANVFAWSYVGSEQYLPELAGELIRYARSAGKRASFLSLVALRSAGGIVCSATPIGALQRLPDLARFSIDGPEMRRLRYMVRRFEKEGGCRTAEYAPGSDPAMDQQIAGLVDAWAGTKQMLNSCVLVVRAELSEGTLDPRHRVFLTFSGDRLVNAIIVTRMPALHGYLLDQEFYPADMPLGGLEYAITQILATLSAQGVTMFSFGASLGVELAESPNAAAEVAEGLRELRSAGIFGAGNFRFKNKFRPVNIPIYLCQPAGDEGTDVSDIILMIANAQQPEPDGSQPARQRGEPGSRPGRPAGSQPHRAAGSQPHRAAGNQPDRAAGAPADSQPGHVGGGACIDLSTDSWGEREHAFIADRMLAIDERAASQSGEPAPAPPWLPLPCLVPAATPHAAFELLCRSWPGPRGPVLHQSLPGGWLLILADSGFAPAALGRRADTGQLDLASVDSALTEAGRPASFCCIELGGDRHAGPPAALGTLRAVRDRLAAARVPLVVAASRILTCALAQADADASDRAIWETVRELLELADAVVLGFTEDFGLDGGALVAARNGDLADLLSERVALRGQEVNLAGRRRIAAVLTDTQVPLALVRRRSRDVAAARIRLAGLGVPVGQAALAHVIKLDAGRLARLSGHRSFLADAPDWLREHAGVLGRPGQAQGGGARAANAEPVTAGGEASAGEVELVVPVGMTPDDLDTVVKRLAALTAGPAAPGRPPGGLAVKDLTAAGGAPSGNDLVLAELGADARRELLRLPGGSVEAFTTGTGPTVLLIHPFNIGAGLFAHQLAGLADRHRLIVAHAPGVGATRCCGELTLGHLAEIQHLALDALGAGWPVHVAGASFGGLVAQEFALRYPADTASLTVICSSYRVANRPGRDLANLAEVTRVDFDRLEAGTGSPLPLTGRRRIEDLILRCESMDPATGLAYLDAYADAPDLLSRLPEISVPTLILQGRYDSVIPVKTGHLLHGLIADSVYAELADAGHFPTVTSPDTVNRLLAEFFSSRDASTAGDGGALAGSRAAKAGRP